MSVLANVGSVAVLLGGMVNLAGAASQIPPPPDLVKVGAAWNGKLTQAGNYKGSSSLAIELKCELKITKRDGEKFEGELTETWGDVKVVYNVKGTAKLKDPSDPKKGYSFDWTSTGTKEATIPETFSNVSYSGLLLDGKLTGEWKFPDNKDGTTLAGKFDWSN